MLRLTRTCALALLLFGGLARALPAGAAEITVFAAASLTNALQDIATAYERGGGEHVVFNFAASSTLARQIEEGAPADLFFSADEAKMETLAKHGELVPESRRGLLSNSLVIVAAVDSTLRISGPRDLLAAAVRVVALAEPQSVPAGIYAKEYLRTAGVWNDVIDKVVPTENVRAALAAVEAGNADLAVVYKTDAAISTKVRVVFEVPAAQAPKISYPVAILAHGAHPDLARRFLAYLESAGALAIFERYGFVVPRAAGVPPQ